MRHGSRIAFLPSHRQSLIALLLLFAAAAILLLNAHPAFAQANGGAGSFSCSNGKASGTLYDSGSSCPTTLEFDHLFSFLVCNMEQLSSNLLGNMFCGVVTSLTPAVSAVLTMAVIIFGLGFTIGVIPATGRDAQMFLIKIAFVWAFATQSDFLIGIGYAFFMNGIRDGVAIALSGYHSTAGSTTGSAVYAEMDEFLAKFIHYATDYMGFTSSQSDPNADCKNAVFVVLAIMAVAFPPIFLTALVLIARMAMTFVRAVFGYVYAIIGIAFLLTLAPFFLSFFLFHQTKPFFDKWIGYLSSFALQIIILFAFLSFILSINVSSITENFSSIIVKQTKTVEHVAFRAPWEYCTLCDFDVINDGPNNLGKTKLQCKSNGSTLDLFTASGPSTQQAGVSKDQQGALLKFAGGSLLTLLVLAYVVEALLNNVTTIAQTLAAGMGAYAAPLVGGGRSSRTTIGLPGEGIINDFGTGFERGFGRSSNSITGTAAGFADGVKRAVMGEEQGEAGAEAGIRNRFVDWLADPNQLGDR